MKHMSPGRQGDERPAFSIGDPVFLQACKFGEPGRVIRIERGKLVILWSDLDYIGRHRPDSVAHAGAGSIPVASQ
jgi:hypothetical protein